MHLKLQTLNMFKATMSYPQQSNYGRGSNLLAGLTTGVVFAVAVTNCVVYSGAITSCNNCCGNSSTSSGDVETTGLNEGCAYIMLIINIIIAIVAFIWMIVFFGRAARGASYNTETVEKTVFITQSPPQGVSNLQPQVVQVQAQPQTFRIEPTPPQVVQFQPPPQAYQIPAGYVAVQ